MFQINKRQGIVVYLYSTRQLKSLKNYGDVIYMSKRLRYVIMYINYDEQAAIIKKITSLGYVKQVTLSRLDRLVDADALINQTSEL